MLMKMKTKTKKIVIIAVIVLAVVIGFVKYRSHSGAQSAEGKTVKASQVQVVTLPQEVHAIGTLIAKSVEITPEIAGHVEQIHFKDGAFVTKDSPLIQLDDAVYKAKFESAKAKLIYSEMNHKRMTLLGKRGAIAQQAIDQAEADLKEKRAEAQESEVMMNKMKLTAPFDGRVGKSNVNKGDYVTVGRSLVVITDTKHLRIEYNVPEKYLASLKLGQEVKLKTAAYPGKIFVGTVSFISPTINTENRSVSIYADVPNDNNQLAPGMFVDATQLLGNQERVLMVPSRSLVPIMDGEQVYKVIDGKASAVTVTVGKRTENDVEIIHGLSSNDMVITDGQHKIKHGMPVKIIQ